MVKICRLAEKIERIYQVSQMSHYVATPLVPTKYWLRASNLVCSTQVISFPLEKYPPKKVVAVLHIYFHIVLRIQSNFIMLIYVGNRLSYHI